MGSEEGNRGTELTRKVEKKERVRGFLEKPQKWRTLDGDHLVVTLSFIIFLFKKCLEVLLFPFFIESKVQNLYLTKLSSWKTHSCHFGKYHQPLAPEYFCRFVMPYANVKALKLITAVGSGAATARHVTGRRTGSTLK